MKLLFSFLVVLLVLADYSLAQTLCNQQTSEGCVEAKVIVQPKTECACPPPPPCLKIRPCPPPPPCPCKPQYVQPELVDPCSAFVEPELTKCRRSFLETSSSVGVKKSKKSRQQPQQQQQQQVAPKAGTQQQVPQKPATQQQQAAPKPGSQQQQQQVPKPKRQGKKVTTKSTKKSKKSKKPKRSKKPKASPKAKKVLNSKPARIGETDTFWEKVQDRVHNMIGRLRLASGQYKIASEGQELVERLSMYRRRTGREKRRLRELIRHESDPDKRLKLKAKVKKFLTRSSKREQKLKNAVNNKVNQSKRWQKKQKARQKQRMEEKKRKQLLKKYLASGKIPLMPKMSDLRKRRLAAQHSVAELDKKCGAKKEKSECAKLKTKAYADEVNLIKTELRYQQRSNRCNGLKPQVVKLCRKQRAGAMRSLQGQLRMIKKAYKEMIKQPKRKSKSRKSKRRSKPKQKA